LFKPENPKPGGSFLIYRTNLHLTEKHAEAENFSTPTFNKSFSLLSLM